MKPILQSKRLLCKIRGHRADMENMVYQGEGIMHVTCNYCGGCSGKHIALEDTPFAGELLDYIQELNRDGVVLDKRGCPGVA